MATAINKRQQVRNEKTLQELVRTVPGNDRCADCSARNPSWASWNLGCFLCMRCAALHRKLGTHITKVKSLSMDTWSVEQVENMKKNGNVAVNRLYNPRNVKANLPVDSDMVDSAVERYIREKYQHRTLAQGPTRSVTSPLPRHSTGGSSTSTVEMPPAVPAKDNYQQQAQLPSPKPGLMARFTSKLSSDRSKNSESSRASRIPESDYPSGRRRSFDGKLAQLREMGFPDENRNATVLKGLGGDIGKTVDALVRLGEGGKEARVQAKVQSSRLQRQQSQQQLPTEPNGSAGNAPDHSSYSTQSQAYQSSSSQQPALPSRSATVPIQQNPWTPDQSSLASGSQSATPSLSPQATSSRNPFVYAQSQAQQSYITSPAPIAQPQQYYQQPQQPTFEQMFQSMAVSQPAFQAPPALFPHSTGNQSSTNNPFMKSMTPPMTPQSFSSYDGYGQNATQQMNGLAQAGNPFLRTSRSQNFATTRMANQSLFGPPSGGSAYDVFQPTVAQQTFQDQHQQPQGHTVPHYTGWAGQQEPQMQQAPQRSFTSPGPQSYNGMQQTSSPTNIFGEQSQQYFSPQSQSPAPLEQHRMSPAPFDSAFSGQTQSASYAAGQPSSLSYPPPQQQQFQQATSPQPLYPQATGRYDKASIMALYSAPRPALPTFTEEPANYNEQQQQQFQTQPRYYQDAQQLQQQQQQQMNAASPSMAQASNNPFAHLQPQQSHVPHQPRHSIMNAATRPGNAGHVSNESADFTGLMMSGRHSPDAFKGLSARVR